MTVVNYYETLDSFIETKEKAKSFTVVVETRSGEQIRSSGLPISFLEVMIATLENADASRTAFSVWDRKNNKLMLVPHDNIKYVSVDLVE
jgi:hypothetical protein